MIADEADIAQAYMNSIQKLLITKIASLDKVSKFYPHKEMTRSDAANWLYEARSFVQRMASQPEPAQSPLTDMKLSVKPVNGDVNEVTVSATVPHPGYGIRIASIVFDGAQAYIHIEPVMPDPDKMYPQVSSEVKAITYVGSAFKPVIAGDRASTGSTGFPIEEGSSSASGSTGFPME